MSSTRNVILNLPKGSPTYFIIYRAIEFGTTGSIDPYFPKTRVSFYFVLADIHELRDVIFKMMNRFENLCLGWCKSLIRQQTW